MENEAENSKRPKGYLHEDFLLFHLKDCKKEQFEYHYHEFGKVIVFISGKVTYRIEGKAYKLKPWDILLITGREIHLPVIDPSEPYERYAIWFKPEFLESQSQPDAPLLRCFETAGQERQYLIRPRPEEISYLKFLLNEMEQASKGGAFGSRITRQAFFLLFIISLNRIFSGDSNMERKSDVQWDETVVKVIEYINQNLAEDLMIEKIAARFFISKYSLMHKFKRQTGYAVYHFILQKRLIAANELIKQGCPFMEASARCGFPDYSCFVRAFTKYFGLSPRYYYERQKQESAKYSKNNDLIKQEK